MYLLPGYFEVCDHWTYLEQDVRDEEGKQCYVVVVASHMEILGHALDPCISCALC